MTFGYTRYILFSTMVKTPLMFLVPLLLTFCLCILGADDFGKFDVNIWSLKKCKGPKRTDCCDYFVNITNNKALYDVKVTEDVSVTDSKIMASKMDKPPFRLQMKKPCEHIFTKPLWKAYFNMTDDCIVPKGHYYFVFDFEEIMMKYYDGMFLYGNWTFKWLSYGPKHNFYCNDMTVEVYPKKNIKN